MARQVAFTDDEESDVDLHEVSPHEVYNPEQLKRLIMATDAGMFQTILMTYASTGMRHGEGLGLKWSNVDFEKREITIQRVYRGKKHGFATTKTTSSTRRIRVSDALILALKKWKLQCPPSSLDIVFPQETDSRRYIEKQHGEQCAELLRKQTRVGEQVSS